MSYADGDFVLDGYEFPGADMPARGPIEEIVPQQWAKQDVIGDANPGSILTFLGTSSQEWEFVSRASAATKVLLNAVYESQGPVNFKTPQNNDVGFSVVMTELSVRYDEPIEDGKYLCKFKLVKR